MGKSWDTPNMDSEQGKSKCPIFKLSQVRDSLWTCPCVYPHVLYSFILLINTLFVSLLSIFVGIIFMQSHRASALSLTTGLVAKIWSQLNLNHWPGTEGLLQAAAGWGPLGSIPIKHNFNYFFLQKVCEKSWKYFFSVMMLNVSFTSICIWKKILIGLLCHCTVNWWYPFVIKAMPKGYHANCLKK